MHKPCLVLAGQPPACFGVHEFSLLLCALQARWAFRRSGFLLAAAERWEEGVAAFQTALKGDVRDAGAQEVPPVRAGP